MAGQEQTKLGRLTLTFEKAMTPIFVFARRQRDLVLGGRVVVQGDL